MKSKLALTNGTIYNGYQIAKNSTLLIEDHLIVGIVGSDEVPEGFEIIDVKGGNVCSGLIDLQIYGTGNDLFSSELTSESLLSIDRQLLAQGCTSYLLTLATNTLEVFKEAIRVFKKTKSKAALGLHLEGPFLNKDKRGAHPAELICKADKATLEDLLTDSAEVVKMMTIAPELQDQECIDYLNELNILLTAGHSTASFDEATHAFNHGVSAVTHLWNAMSAFHHRNIGLPGASFNHDTVCASIIVDGVHVDFEAVKVSKQMMGERLFLITDAVGACSKGIYQHVLNKDHFVLPDGTLSGSALTLLKAIQNCVQEVQIPLDESIRMATLYPARLLKNSTIGNLNMGSFANVLVFNSNFEVEHVLFEGVIVK